MHKKNKLSITSIIKGRKSVRGFLNKKIPTNKIKKIFGLAQHAPSNCNIQPWVSFVSSGRSKNILSQKFLNAHKKKIKPSKIFGDGKVSNKIFKTLIKLSNKYYFI